MRRVRSRNRTVSTRARVARVHARERSFADDSTFSTQRRRFTNASVPPIDRRLIAHRSPRRSRRRRVGRHEGARHAVDRDPQAGLIDWEQARGIADQHEPGQHADRGRARAARRLLPRAWCERCVPIVAPTRAARCPTRIGANVRLRPGRLDQCQSRRVQGDVRADRGAEPGHRRANARSRRTSGADSTARSSAPKSGLLLGYLARRVLGQYDLALLGREPVTTGKLYYVEPNIRHVERTLGLPARRVPDVAGAARDDPRLRVRGAPVGARPLQRLAGALLRVPPGRTPTSSNTGCAASRSSSTGLGRAATATGAGSRR